MKYLGNIPPCKDQSRDSTALQGHIFSFQQNLLSFKESVPAQVIFKEMVSPAENFWLLKGNISFKDASRKYSVHKHFKNIFLEHYQVAPVVPRNIIAKTLSTNQRRARFD